MDPGRQKMAIGIVDRKAKGWNRFLHLKSAREEIIGIYLQLHIAISAVT